MAFGDADLRVFFGMGVPVAFQGVSTYANGSPIKGNLDRPLQAKLGGGFGGIGTALPALRLPYNAFTPMPMERDDIMVDGIQYTVEEITAEGDGSVVCLELKAASL